MCPVDAAIAAVRTALAAYRADCTTPSRIAALRVAVALSGGRDSMVLLDVLARLAPELQLVPSAIHVHHGLSLHADAWAAFCDAECAQRGIALTVHRVDVPRVPRASLEATARTARYAALVCADVDAVMLGHHADDQAETLLLQLLRGAGPQGLASMPALRAGHGPAFLRPLLELPRAVIEEHARRYDVRWIDDESNANTGLRRNFLRHEIAPRLRAAFPGYPATLVRAAAHAAEASRLLDVLAAQDAGVSGIVASTEDTAALTLERAAFVALAERDPARARNLLRWFLRRHALPLPSTARLAAMQNQIVRATPDARVRLVHAGAEIGIHRGRIVVHAPPAVPYAVRWNGEHSLTLPHGTLAFGTASGVGLAADAIDGAPIVVRPREGGERIRLASNRPRHSLKHLLQEAGIPAWQRVGWPVVWCGDALAAVPGIGVAFEFQAQAGARGYELTWRPHL